MGAFPEGPAPDPLDAPMPTSAPAPYWQDGRTTLYQGDCREIIPALGLEADVAICDPPYEATSLGWDRWPDGWPAALAASTRQMWCFGSMRMFLDRGAEFTSWRLAQDLVWEKNAGTNFTADRFRRVHEHALHWYRGSWDDLYRLPQREPRTGPYVAHVVASDAPVPHTGEIGAHSWTDDGTRLVKSVVRAPSVRHTGFRTVKPAAVLRLLLAYSCPPGGLVLDPMAGSGSTLEAARALGMRAVGIEADPAHCAAIAERLAQGVLA